MYREIQRPIQTISGRQDIVDGSRLLNLYASQSIMPDEAKVTIPLNGVPGFTPWYTGAKAAGKEIHSLLAIDDPVLGKHVHVLKNRNKFAVYGSDGVQVGNDYDVPSNVMVPEGPLKMATDGRRTVFVTPSEIHSFDQGKKAQPNDVSFTPGFEQIVAPVADDPTETSSTENWVDVVWIDGYFIIANENGQVFNSTLYETQFDQLDFARADTNPDGIVGMETIDRRLFVFGKKSIENWFNAGADGFAFERDLSRAISVGAVSRNAITSNEVAIIFVGNDLSVYVIGGGGAIIKISNESVDSAIARSDASKARAFAYTEEGHKFYSLSLFSDAGVSLENWTYDFRTQLWAERTTKNITSYTRLDAKSLVGNEESDSIFQMSLNFGTGFSDDILPKEMIFPIVHEDHNRIRHFNLQLDVNHKHFDVANTDMVFAILTWSNDLKQTWSNERPREITPGIRAKWTQLGSVRFFGRHYRVQFNDSPGRLTVLGAYITSEVLAD